jgi:hypothetical protein
MSGYTPLFDTLTQGTLCGRWPDIGLWPIVLSMSNKDGVVDVTPTYISSITGLGMEDVVACMRRFCEPDPYSRSQLEAGRRLVLLDDHREWGWRIVNHTQYRERARKQAWDAERTASGRDAERKRRERAERTDDVPTCPDVSRLSPLSNANTYTEPPSLRSGGAGGACEHAPSTDEAEAAPPPAVRKRPTQGTFIPDDFVLTPDRRAVAEAEKLPAERTFAAFCDYWRAASGQRARKRNWDSTWRNWCRTEADRSRGTNGQLGPRKTRYEQLTEDLASD